MNDVAPRTVLAAAPKEIDRAAVLAELRHRFEEDDPNDALAWALDALAYLDILAFRPPADDPSKDPIGTVRREQHPEDATGEGYSVWQHMRSATGFGSVWQCVHSTHKGNLGECLHHDQVRGMPVIGGAPGTPAAEAHATQHSINVLVENREHAEATLNAPTDTEPAAPGPLPCPVTPRTARDRFFQDQHGNRWKLTAAGDAFFKPYTRLVGDVEWEPCEATLASLSSNPNIREVLSDAS